MPRRVVTSLILVAVGAIADTTFEVFRGVTTTTHDKPPSSNRTLETLRRGAEPTTEESRELLRTYHHGWTVSLPDMQDLQNEADDRKLTVKIWDPNRKSFPGWNSPCAEIFHENKRLGFHEFREVGMLSDVWAASHEGHDYLYIQSSHRHRYADGIYAYELDHTTFGFRYVGLVFTKDALAQEQKDWSKQ